MRQIDTNPDPYARRFRAPLWNRTVTVCDVPRLWRQLPEFHDWTAARHTRVARDYLAAEVATTCMYDGMVRRAFATWGDGNGVLIAGVIREHFPETIKTDLRTVVCVAGQFADRSLMHWRAARRTTQTWRRERDALREG